MSWQFAATIFYVPVLIFTCLRIIFDTRNVTKALAYLLLAVFVPVGGIAFYFLFGTNYRKRKIYTKKLVENEALAARLKKEIVQYSSKVLREGDQTVRSQSELAHLLLNDSLSPLTASNSVKLLRNGEEKFPEVLEALRGAKDHIHIEYYIYEDDEIGREVEQVLIAKAREGVKVRMIYDDFGSRSIRSTVAKRLRASGVEVFPFFRVIFVPFANRLNYRNHRKIIVVDGRTAFTGGINVSDRYINRPGNSQELYWRDTHLRIDGPGVQHLQYHFLCDWNFCAGATLQPTECFFPRPESFPKGEDKVVQIAASGPDSERPLILFSVLTAINLATEEILIATPYFIPGESLLSALVIASLSGLKVKILVPGVSDSMFVNIAACSYFDDLLAAGVEIYRYQKGFMHSKTMVTDRKIAVVGTANMDIRSFDLNFEVNAIVYDKETACALSEMFFEDLKDAVRIDPAEWGARSRAKRLMERTARLMSPLL